MCQALCELLGIYSFNLLNVSIIIYLLPIPSVLDVIWVFNLLFIGQKSSIFGYKSPLFLIVFEPNLSPPLQKPNCTSPS